MTSSNGLSFCPVSIASPKSRLSTGSLRQWKQNNTAVMRIQRLLQSRSACDRCPSSSLEEPDRRLFMRMTKVSIIFANSRASLVLILVVVCICDLQPCRPRAIALWALGADADVIRKRYGTDCGDKRPRQISKNYNTWRTSWHVCVLVES